MSNLTLDNNKYYCLFSSNKHLLRDPKILPCSGTACLKCIQSITKKSNSFYCKFCNDTHDLNDLQPNDEYAKNFKTNLKYISILLNNSLKSRLSYLIETKDNNNLSIGQIFDSMEYEIDIKVESLRHDLTIFYDNLNSTCNFIKENYESCSREDYLKYIKSLSKDISLQSFGKILITKIDKRDDELKCI
jgi:hypothetical protein